MFGANKAGGGHAGHRCIPTLGVGQERYGAWVSGVERRHMKSQTIARRRVSQLGCAQTGQLRERRRTQVIEKAWVRHLSSQQVARGSTRTPGRLAYFRVGCRA